MPALDISPRDFFLVSKMEPEIKALFFCFFVTVKWGLYDNHFLMIHDENLINSDIVDGAIQVKVSYLL